MYTVNEHRLQCNPKSIIELDSVVLYGSRTFPSDIDEQKYLNRTRTDEISFY